MILHVDMDAFYASIEQRDRPDLAGRPVIVGGSPTGRGVVAAANYAVRKFGVHSAMPVSTALKLCPQAIVLPVRMSHYAAISRQIREIFFRYTPLVEPLALDEAFLDVSGCQALFGPPAQIARDIKSSIQQETGLIASVGVAPNKFLAKIASDLDKPDGLVIVPPHQVNEFLDPLPVSRLWGVGKVTDRSLQRIGVRTIGQLRGLATSTLHQLFGDIGDHFSRLAHGLDDRPVVPDRVAKSISHETTFPTDLSDIESLRDCLLNLTDQVARRLRRHNHLGRTVQIKLRYADFRTITRAKTLPSPTNSTEALWQAADELLTRALSTPNQRPFAIRLLGMGISGFTAALPIQRLLFDDPTDQQQAKQQRLDRVSDAVRDRFGPSAIRRGRTLRPGRPDPPNPS